MFSAPRYHWVERRHPLAWLSDLWNHFLDWVDRVNSAHPTLSWVLFFGALALLALLLTHIGFTMWRIYRATALPAAATARGTAGVVLQDARSHRLRAEALARQGRYEEALAHRFAALICDLEEAKAVTVHPSKTPAEYAREARVDATGRITLVGLVSILYAHLFGAEPLDERQYREFVSTADQVLAHVGSH